MKNIDNEQLIDCIIEKFETDFDNIFNLISESWTKNGGSTVELYEIKKLLHYYLKLSFKDIQKNGDIEKFIIHEKIENNKSNN